MESERLFSVGEAAKAARTTSETLRHYDRIGLVKPSKKDERTRYRYYTEQDIVRLNTVRALQLMDLSLQEIQKVLEYDDLMRIVGFLEQAERKADEKIAALQRAKAKIALAKADYERKLHQGGGPTGPSAGSPGDAVLKEIPERVILLSDVLEVPTLDNLWNYLGHFYSQLDSAVRDQFDFEDLAGVYREGGVSRLFAVCVRHGKANGLKALPAGTYLCAPCTEEDREAVLAELVQAAQMQYGAAPRFTVQLVVVSGILRWGYEAQVYVGDRARG